LAICQPSEESAVVLLAVYCAELTLVQLPLSEPLTRVRNPSDASVVVFVVSYVACVMLVVVYVGPKVPVIRTRQPSVLSLVVLPPAPKYSAAVDAVHVPLTSFSYVSPVVLRSKTMLLLRW